MATTDFRFRVSKAVGSPSVQGAGSVETLANHTENPQPHPQYQRKSEAGAEVDMTSHLASRIDHARHHALRDELMTTKLEYEKYKNMSLSRDASNYLAPYGIKAHVVTAFVLNQILNDVGLDGSVKALTYKNLVNSYDTHVSDGSKYAPTWEIFLKLRQSVVNQSTDVAAAAKRAAVKAAEEMIQQFAQTFTANAVKMIYPVGSVYISMDGDNEPFPDSGTHWELIGKGKTLWGYDPEDVHEEGEHEGEPIHPTGDELDPGLPALPDLKTSWEYSSSGSGTESSIHGGTSSPESITTKDDGTVVKTEYDEDTKDDIYGNSDTVQPPAVVVAFWRRVS